jgi:aldehyde:ferredoxin oxidoreductase
MGMLLHPGRTLGVSAAMGAPSYSPGWPVNEMMKQAGRCGVPLSDMGRLFTSDSFNLGRLVKHGEDFFGLFNMLGQCHRLYISRFFSLDMLAALYSSITGMKASSEELKAASSRMWDSWRELNAAAGYTPADDAPPSIWFKPLRGPSGDYRLLDYNLKRELTLKDIEGLLADYYDERGRSL